MLASASRPSDAEVGIGIWAERQSYAEVGIGIGPSDKVTQKPASASGLSGATVNKSPSSEPGLKEASTGTGQAAAADAAIASQVSAPGGSLGDNDQNSLEPVLNGKDKRRPSRLQSLRPGYPAP